ncbi:MAG: leucine-rich repeat domain-containing protein [Clostridiales bacterium]|nr:leucine-rich repeat domain-containing protein [Clostridiales bacterium]
MQNKSKIIFISIISVMLLCIMGLTIGIVLVASNAEQDNNITISYEANNVDATITASGINYASSEDTTGENILLSDGKQSGLTTGTLTFKASQSEVSGTLSFDYALLTATGRAVYTFKIKNTADVSNTRSLKLMASVQDTSNLDNIEVKFGGSEASAIESTVGYVEIGGGQNTNTLVMMVTVDNTTLDVTNATVDIHLQLSCDLDVSVSGTTAVAPAIQPVAKQYFEGWYLDEALTTKATFPLQSNTSVTLYPKYMESTSGMTYSYSSTTKSYLLTKGLDQANVVIPNSYNDGTHGVAPVSKVARSAFNGFTNLNSVVIPNSVTSIETYAFYQCSALSNVVIPYSVNSIGNAAFYACSSLGSIVIPEGVISIGNNTFAYCSSLSSVSIPDSVTNIGQYAFSNCSGLSEITIPGNVTSIGANAFAYCSALTDITIPSSVTNMGNYVFYQCENLINVTLEEGIKSIPNCAFGGCINLLNINIPDSITSISPYAFHSCNSLTSITIPDSVTSIGNNAFYSCSALTSITIPDSVKNIGSNLFYDCGSLSNVTLSNNITSIGESTFFGCTKLTEIIIPASVTSIGTYAFYECKALESVTIPSNVASIGSVVFFGCSNLTTLSFDEPSGWYKYDSENDTYSDSYTLSSASDNATNFTSNQNYYNYSWERK